ncbi:MAG: hypothetical protein Q7T91_00490 [Sulfuricurvum sp.]|nr:hypothetical protein [Sulfuricurvum sp.]
MATIISNIKYIRKDGTREVITDTTVFQNKSTTKINGIIQKYKKIKMKTIIGRSSNDEEKLIYNILDLIKKRETLISSLSADSINENLNTQKEIDSVEAQILSEHSKHSMHEKKPKKKYKKKTPASKKEVDNSILSIVSKRNKRL